jgi:hypothetical protein
VRLLLGTGRSSRSLALSDAVAIVVFATIGLLSHRHGIGPRGYARDALPVLAGWFGAALVFGAYSRRTTGALLLTWIVGVPLGVLIRGLALGRSLDGDQAAFLVVTLVFTLAFVLALRVAAGFAAARRR